MTGLLEQALKKVAALSDQDQDSIATQILDTLNDDASWEGSYALRQEEFRAMADAAIDEHRRGVTRPLDEL